ncbi:hypothetical protein P7K49_031047 [Saguinus oedipus]|uniref:Uncharacterized protein n=1 Tax=Saguinus oedipus TaxID=9490 RepID=A0ABQ9U536_SAGOE|nr:hypothetical protein P7K49_031047 [Saguinus oedipus]
MGLNLITLTTSISQLDIPTALTDHSYDKLEIIHLALFAPWLFLSSLHDIARKSLLYPTGHNFLPLSTPYPNPIFSLSPCHIPSPSHSPSPSFRTCPSSSHSLRTSPSPIDILHYGPGLILMTLPTSMISRDDQSGLLTQEQHVPGNRMEQEAASGEIFVVTEEQRVPGAAYGAVASGEIVVFPEGHHVPGAVRGAVASGEIVAVTEEQRAFVAVDGAVPSCEIVVVTEAACPRSSIMSNSIW